MFLKELGLLFMETSAKRGTVDQFTQFTSNVGKQAMSLVGTDLPILAASAKSQDPDIPGENVTALFQW